MIKLGRNLADFKKEIVGKLRGNYFINCTPILWNVFNKYSRKRVRNVLKS